MLGNPTSGLVVKVASIDFKQLNATVIYADNQGTIALSKNPRSHSRTKHIDIKYHYVHEAVGKKRDYTCKPEIRGATFYDGCRTY